MITEKAKRRLRQMDQNEAYAWGYRIYNRMMKTPEMTPKRKRLAVQHCDILYAAATEFHS